MRSHLLRAVPKSRLWTPAAITTALWLDASDSSTITTVSGNVSEWRDKSGNDRHFEQATSDSRPALTAAGLNGLDVLTFDGTDDRLASTAAASTWAFMHNKSSGSTVYAVFTHSAGDDRDAILSTEGLLSGNIGYSLIAEGLSTSVDAIRQWVSRGVTGSVAVNALSADNMVAASTATLICSIVNQNGPTDTFPARADLVVNGTVQVRTNSAIGDPSTAAPTANMSIGSNGPGTGAFLGGFIAELIIRTGLDGTTDRQLVEGYLAHKWGLAASLPSGHPYKDAAPEILGMATAAGVYLLSGLPSGLVFPTFYSLDAASGGAYSVTGQPVAINQGQGIEAAGGSYGLTGQPINLAAAYNLATSAGAYVLTGQAAALAALRGLAAGAGAFGIDGQPAELSTTLGINAAAGAYTLTGNAAETQYGGTTAYDLGALVGTYAWTGQPVTVRKGFRLTAQRELFATVGKANLTNRQRFAVADRGTFTVNGRRIYPNAPGGRRRFALIP
jgi:hypothetical protein